jgi:hypothetical protein
VVVQGISGCTQSDGHLEKDAQKVMISPKKMTKSDSKPDMKYKSLIIHLYF